MPHLISKPPGQETIGGQVVFVAIPLLVGLLFVAELCQSARSVENTPSGELRAARKLFLGGRYQEAAAVYEARLEAEPISAAVGLAQCYAARGEYDRATTTLESALAPEEAETRSADPPAALAELAFARGDHESAAKFVDQALTIDKNHLAARWLQAELFAAQGQMEAANKAYQWFVDHYNATDEFKSADDLWHIGQGAAQFARWNRLSDQFTFLVNELYPDALKLEPNFWPAQLAQGQLFLEKYNQAEAARALKAALAMNASNAEIHAALAELSIQNFELEAATRSVRAALAVNPRHLRAHLMQADIHLANFEPEVAVGVLEAALKLNPNSEETLGRLAAAYGMVDGLSDQVKGTRLGGLIDRALARNPHCGVFFFALGEALDKGRKFPTAAHYYSKAVEVMPQHAVARGQLGLMQMRLGEEAAARKVLEESFDIDPFNVRVINSIKVLEVLDEYETLETEHFILKYDPRKDKLLAQYAARYLEEIHPELCARLDFSPPEKSLFEIFNHARNTEGHGWFSARMVGLPNIHTIGACAGKMVALTSPSAMKQRFNWARVLRHEFVHVINLQQTNFNIPHWYTEALAVLLEDSPRPAEWNTMLARRVPAGKTFNLESINLGFIRPGSGEDWQMAYCQAEIYAEYMIERFGPEAIGKMLAGYRDNLNTAAAIERAFNVSVEDFEQGYTEHLAVIVRSLAPQQSVGRVERDFVELQKARAAEPENLELTADLALAHLRRKQLPEAGQLADRVLAKTPTHAVASYVKARLLLTIGEGRRALQLLEAGLDREAPHADLVRLLAGLRFKAEDFAAAETLYLLAEKHDPHNPEWTKSLAMVYLKSGEADKLTERLARMAVADADDLLLRKKLAELAVGKKDFTAAARWANQALQIDVMDATMHATLAGALLELDQPTEAEQEFRVALELEAKNSAWRVELARAQAARGEPATAKQTLQELLRSEPNHSAAQELLNSLNQE